MSRLTILIPDISFNEAVEQTLVSVLQHRPEYSEVIVATKEPYADPYELGREVRFLCNETCESRLDLINFGCRESRGTVLHILLPGMLALDGWTDRVLRHFAEEDVAAVAPLIVRSSETDFIAGLGVSFSPVGSRHLVSAGARIDDSRLGQQTVLGPALSAGFYRNETLAALTGFDVEYGEAFADVEMGLALHDLGFKTKVEPASRVATSHVQPLPPRTYQDARSAERLFLRQCGRSTSRFRHTLLVASEILCGFPRARMITRFAGRMAARRGTNPRIAYEARLERARTELQQRVEDVSTIRGEFASAYPSRARRTAA